MPIKRAFPKAKSRYVFGQARKAAKMLRAGLYARVSTNDQQTIPLQIRALREYAARRGWTIALQVKEVGSGAGQRQLREKVLEAARRREIDVVLVWRLDRWGRSVADLLATLQELDHRGVGFVSLNQALDLTTPAGRAMAALLAVFRGLRAGDPAGTNSCWTGARPRERQAPGPARNRCTAHRRDPETTSRWRRQSRDRPPARGRAHFSTPNPG
jgi:Resolvase, N terminal domain